MISLQWTTGTIGVAIAVLIVLLVRKDRLYTRYSLWWLMMATLIFILGVFPDISDILAGYLGIAYPPSLVFIFAIVLLVVKNLLMDIERSKLEVKLRRLSQRMAILEDRLQRAEEHKGGE